MGPSSTFRQPHLSPSLFCVPWPLAASPSLALGVHSEASQLSISSPSPQRGSCIVQGPALSEDLPALGSLRPSLCGTLHLVWLENPLLGPLVPPPLTQPCNCPITPASVKGLTHTLRASIPAKVYRRLCCDPPASSSQQTCPCTSSPSVVSTLAAQARTRAVRSLPARLTLHRKPHAHLCALTRRASAC